MYLWAESEQMWVYKNLEHCHYVHQYLGKNTLIGKNYVDITPNNSHYSASTLWMFS